ncbi:MAG: substrate-binding domain-containing protein, partial [Oscillibacter sp.]|nr:substrate-binding domain-containing protein [Oscillibacter sp.]
EPPAALWDEKDAAGFAWEMNPVAADALVFAVSADNPVDSLTVAELRGIYAGTITNWAELGGPDLPILPLRGDAGSDAETAMENLVMDGVPMLSDPALVRESGEELLSGAAQSGAVAPGGLYRTIALAGTEAASGWKLIAVDGAAPSKEAVRSGSYPLLNRCYVLISAAASQDSSERALRDWLVSRDGQEAASRAGYIPMMELGGA